jgi:phosphoribosyl-ATP pyrophosphohydrolase/phosphoribosyl-AMP cyclohydrolase
MIIPSIDLMNKQAVQLVGGKEKAIDAGDPRPIMAKFALAGDVAIIDLDAALGYGSNSDTIIELIRKCPCRVGGGIRDIKTAIGWLDKGARKIILGTAATPELLSQLPRHRTIVALDNVEGNVVVDGWRKVTGESVENRLLRLRDLTGGFLITFVENEGRMTGIDLNRVRHLKEIAGETKLTVAGGVSTTDEIRELDRLGVDVQVGMALYTNKINLADAIVAPMQQTGEKPQWPTVIVDEYGIALGLAWSDIESLREAIDKNAGVYHSRKRGLWIKGKTSGNSQQLLRIELDCDRDTLRFVVKQSGNGFCHTGKRTCWGDDWGLPRLERRLRFLQKCAPERSVTNRLLNNPELLKEKILEEAKELIEAENQDQVIQEAADLMYFTFVYLLQSGCSLHEIAGELDYRSLKITRRPINSKIQG